jgi:hypothetical protein
LINQLQICTYVTICMPYMEDWPMSLKGKNDVQFEVLMYLGTMYEGTFKKFQALDMSE